MFEYCPNAAKNGFNPITQQGSWRHLKCKWKWTEPSPQPVQHHSLIHLSWLTTSGINLYWTYLCSSTRELYPTQLPCPFDNVISSSKTTTSDGPMQSLPKSTPKNPHNISLSAHGGSKGILYPSFAVPRVDQLLWIFYRGPFRGISCCAKTCYNGNWCTFGVKLLQMIIHPSFWMSRRHFLPVAFSGASSRDHHVHHCFDNFIDNDSRIYLQEKNMTIISKREQIGFDRRRRQKYILYWRHIWMQFGRIASPW